jgi:cell division protein ZapA (FtsZ GTPase activity inhibitor)
MQKNTVALTLAGKKFQVPCAPSDAPDLLLAAQAVNDALHKPSSLPLETRLLMLSLNLSYELLQADRFTKSLESEVSANLRQVQRMLEEQKAEEKGSIACNASLF